MRFIVTLPSCQGGEAIGISQKGHAPRALTGWERHNETHECFILLSGQGTMYTRMVDGDEPIITEMEMNVIYDVLPGEWHHITVSPDATVLIVENADTSAANSDKYAVDGGERV